MNTIEQLFGVEQDTDRRAECLKTVFLRDELGRRAFEYLLLELKFLEPCQNEGDTALCNKAKDLVAIVYGERIAANGLLTWFRKIFNREQRKGTNEQSKER